MRIPKNIKLLKATYVRDYIYRFEFSNGKVFETNFRPMLYHGTMYMKYLDVIKFKKMGFEKEGDIYWGKNWDLCFHLDGYYGKKKVVPIPSKAYRDYLKKHGYGR